MTLKEIATETRLGLETLRKLVNSGEIPAVKLGRHYLVKRADFLNWFESKRVTKDEFFQIVKPLIKRFSLEGMGHRQTVVTVVIMIHEQDWIDTETLMGHCSSVLYIEETLQAIAFLVDRGLISRKGDGFDTKPLRDALSLPRSKP